MGQDGEIVVGNALDPCHGACRGDEGLGAKDCRGDAQLFEGDAVVQTARRAGASIPVGRDQHIAALGHLLDNVLGTGCGSVGLRVSDHL